MDVFYGGPLDGRTTPTEYVDGNVLQHPESGSRYVRTPTLDSPGQRAWVHGTGTDIPLTSVDVRPQAGAKTLTLTDLRDLVAAADATGMPADADVHVEVTFKGLAKRLALRHREAGK